MSTLKISKKLTNKTDYESDLQYEFIIIISSLYLTSNNTE